MKRYINLFFISAFSCLFLYVMISFCFRIYVHNNTAISFLNEKYTKFDSLEGEFIPFGADNSWYSGKVDYYTLFGLSFLKSDKERNFVYYNNILGAIVYKKDSYKVPETPTADLVDELILYCESDDRDIYIEDKEDIDYIINFLSTYDDSAGTKDSPAIVFYAISNTIGGIFQLNENGSIYLKENDIMFDDSVARISFDKMHGIIEGYLGKTGIGAN